MSRAGHARGHTQITPFGAGRACRHPITERALIGGSARGYQTIFVPLAALSSPATGLMDGQPPRIFIHRRT